ncbi:MAG: hypothetical protein AMS24_02080 [Chlamydiae bacterium SM23_39]|nr:MAG: hypothetical protein AMS24_02080 [Chlamydiae bacterium SM23_39]
MLKRKKINIKPFTLIEILISISILSMVSFIVGIKIEKCISKYRFERNYSKILRKFLFIKDISISNQCDLEIELKQKKRNLLITIGIDSDTGLFPNKKREKEKFSNLYFKFIGKKKIENFVKLFFSSTGNFYPKGKIILYNEKKKLFKEIDLNEIFLKEFK